MSKLPLMEILKGDDLVEDINRTGKKISIRHYLNIYLFPTGTDKQGRPRFPLYYRLIFNKQTAKIKSTINVSYSLAEFKEVSLADKDLMRREALLLTHLVSDTYCEVINALNTNLNEESKSENSSFEKQFLDSNSLEDFATTESERIEKSFDINQIFNTYEFSSYELPVVVEKKILNDMITFSKALGQFDELEGIFSQSKTLNCYQILQYLKNKNSEWKKFEKRYHPLIWFFNIYYFQFKNQSVEYKIVGATIIDFYFLNFKNVFLEFYPDQDFKELLQNVEYLIRP